MTISTFFHKKIIQSCICMLLCAAIVLSIALPEAGLIQAHPDNPLGDAQIREITVLNVSEKIQELGQIAVPGQEEGISGEGEDREPEEAEKKAQESGGEESDGPDVSEEKGSAPEEQESEGQEFEEAELKEDTPENTDPQEDMPGEQAAGESGMAEAGESEGMEQDPESGSPEESGQEEVPAGEPVEGETEPEDSVNPKDEVEGKELEEEDPGEEREDITVELAGVLTWYKYGVEPKTMTCSTSGSVSKTLNTAQLKDHTLHYMFDLTGRDAKFAKIQSVSMEDGEGESSQITQSGAVQILLPAETERRCYTFRLTALIQKTGAYGEQISQEVDFTFILQCIVSLDLDLELIWYPDTGKERMVICSPDTTEALVVKNQDITDRVFPYQVKLTGALAEHACITDAGYTTSSGGKSGSLSTDSGTLILDTAEGGTEETYWLTFTVAMEQRKLVYQFRLTYQEIPDIQLAFRWMEKDMVQKTAICQPGGQAAVQLRNNRLSAGVLSYEMELMGSDGKQGRILSVSYTSGSGDSGNLEPVGSLPVSMMEGESFHTYHMTVSAMVHGRRTEFEVVIHYSADLTLQMEYTVKEGRSSAVRTVTCENTGSQTAEVLYDDQLTEGVLHYSMSLIGEESSRSRITSVSCYQSGSGRTVSLGADGEIPLLLKDGKTGENTFEVTATDTEGNSYRFTLHLPYKHRGENKIRIQTNLTDGQEIINETTTNLTVKAWSEDDSGQVVSYIPANGIDTKLVVQLDGQKLSYVSSSGAVSEYELYPENPDVGDSNTHTLTIYAEDALGNYGELILSLHGERREAGQKIGRATIYVDMTVLGLGTVACLNYQVLADEPISYVIAKAIMGQDTGEPFGAAEETLGWSGRYAGRLEDGFYLQSLTTGHDAHALEDSRWPGGTEEEVFQAIDAYFGAGSGLATLWRCLYRNGLNKSSGSGNTFGEFDYTSGSGWMYSVGGASYYPGQSMSGVYLKDGDVLTIRYTLAYGWDVGGGAAGYGNTTGYCVSAVNGSYRIHHQMETLEHPDGSITYACRCCGIVEDCVHTHVTSIDLGNGTHTRYCEDCSKEIEDPVEHIWTYADSGTGEQHICSVCGAVEMHHWREVEGSSTASCTMEGSRSVQCLICHQIRDEITAPLGHTLDHQWQYTPQMHYEKCSVCGEEINHGEHQYRYVSGSGWEDFECEICHALHADDGDHCHGNLIKISATCQKWIYHCDYCQHDLVQTGVFEECHSYINGICQYCGSTEDSGVPDAEEPEPEEPSEPEPEEPSEPEPEEPLEPEPEEPSEPEPEEPLV